MSEETKEIKNKRTFYQKCVFDSCQNKINISKNGVNDENAKLFHTFPTQKER